MPTGGFHSGPAAARISSAASVRRSNVSHHGVRDGVSSFGAMSNSIRVGGKYTTRGRGGTMRSSHHSDRQAEQTEQDQGAVKASGRPSIGGPPLNHMLRSPPRRRGSSPRAAAREETIQIAATLR